jgi:OPA family glycerol-3-phosphate transporter-like MFS transporter
VGAEYIKLHWGFLICVVGIFGGFFGGIVSDKFFQSRRAPPTALAQALIFASAVVMIFTIHSAPIVTGICCLVIACLVICTHSLMSGTAAADFGGRKATATASGILDGFVYLGSGLQSVCIGYLSAKDWIFWPIFMAPFAFVGMVLALKTWQELPEATKRYILHVEQTKIQQSAAGVVITKTTSDLEVVRQRN